MENSRQIILDKFNENEKAITNSIEELSTLRDELHNLRMTYSKSNDTQYFYNDPIITIVEPILISK
jgi:hypothetical protein